MSIREEIFASRDCATEAVQVPEWPVPIFVRGLTLAEHSSIMEATNAMAGASEIEKSSSLTRRLVLYGVCDASGRRVFEDGDFGELGGRNLNVLNRLAMKVLAISKLSPGDAKELEKNSDATQTEGSASS